MKIRIDNRISTLCASSLVLWLAACNGELAVVDSLDGTSASLSSYRSAGPGLNASCACASSDSLMALSCGGGTVPLFDNDVVQTTADGGVVAFNLCDDTVGPCHVVYWDGGFAEFPSASGLLIGLSASGAQVLTTGDGIEPGLQLIDLNGTTVIPFTMVQGKGSLSASGDTVIGTTPVNGVYQLTRWSSSTGEVDVLGEMDSYIVRAYMTPDASGIVGADAAGQPYRWNEQGMSFGLPGLPASFTWVESISADGAVVTGLSGQTNFRWTEAEGYVELALSSGRSETYLSADGSVVLGSLDPQGANDSSAFRWTQATGAVEIAPGFASLATDMSDDGSVVVASSWEEAQNQGASPEHTYIWDTANGTRTLDQVLAARGADTTGWEFGHARALSGNGKVLLGRATCGGVPTLYRVVLAD